MVYWTGRTEQEIVTESRRETLKRWRTQHRKVAGAALEQEPQRGEIVGEEYGRGLEL